MAVGDVTASIETNGWDEVATAWIAGVNSSGTTPVRTAHHEALETDVASRFPTSDGYHRPATMTELTVPNNAGYQKSPLPKTLRFRIGDTGTLPVFTASTLAVYLRRNQAQGPRSS